MRGLVIISIPKSGTMFLSLFLAHIASYRFRYGFIRKAPANFPQRKTGRPPLNAQLQKASKIIHFRNGIKTTKLEDQFYKQNTDTSATHKDKWVIADHGIGNLAGMFQDPSFMVLLTPKEVQEKANEKDLGVLFLYREFRDTLNSLSHFLLDKRPDLHSLVEANNLVINGHAPRLAQHIRTWKEDFSGMQITYEQLRSDTKNKIRNICEQFELPFQESQLIDKMSDFKTWTYRKGGSGDWKHNFTEEQSQFLLETYPDLC